MNPVDDSQKGEMVLEPWHIDDIYTKKWKEKCSSFKSIDSMLRY